jgi:hypothetical protein
MILTTMTIFFHRKPLFTGLIIFGVLLLIFLVFYLSAAATPTRIVPVIAFETQPADMWADFEKWITRIVLIVTVSAFVGSVVWYFFRGKNWESMNENSNIQSKLITSLQTELAQMSLDLSECRATLKRSRNIRVGQRKIILRLIARLEGEDKDFADIMAAEEEFDFDKP